MQFEVVHDLQALLALQFGQQQRFGASTMAEEAVAVDSAAAAALLARVEAAKVAVRGIKAPVIHWNRINHDIWRKNVDDRFFLCGLDDLLLAPGKPGAVADRNLQQVGRSLLLQSLKDEDHELAYNGDTVYESLELIRVGTQGTRRIQQVATVKDFLRIKMDAGEDAASLKRRVEAAARRMRDLAVDLDMVSVVKFLDAAAEQSDTLRAAVDTLLSSDLPLSMEQAFTTVRAVEVNRANAAPPSGAAFAATGGALGAGGGGDATAVQQGAEHAVAFAALSKQISDLRSQLGQQRNKQPAGNQQNSGPKRAAPGRGAQPRNDRYAPYAGRGGGRAGRGFAGRGGFSGGFSGGRGGGRGRGGGYSAAPSGDAGKGCLNCGKNNHATRDCWTACRNCGAPGPYNGGHSAHECANPTQGRSPMANASVAVGNNGHFNPFGPFNAAAFTHQGSEMYGRCSTPYPADMPSILRPSGMPPFNPEMAMASTSYVGPHFDNGGSAARRANRFSPFHSKGQWFLDNGSSHHMTACHLYLHNYVADPTPKCSVTVGGGRVLQRAGVGTLRFTATVNGKTRVHELHNVWHVPELHISLLSPESMFRDQELWVTQGGPHDNTYYVVNAAGECILECPHTGIPGTLNIPTFRPEIGARNVDNFTLSRFPYHQCVNPALKKHATPERFVPPVPLQAEAAAAAKQTEVCNPGGVCTFALSTHASDPETAKLWHQRLGHMNYQSLFQLVRDNQLTGISLPSEAFKAVHNCKCDVCIMAKHNRAPAAVRRERAEHAMDVLHSDVIVYPTESLDGSKYAVTLMDEYSGYAGIAVLKKKSAVEDVLRAAIIKWETLTNRRCRKLFTDRGGEYLGANFARWCADKGIIHEKSMPRTPSQNGKAERLNQTLNNHVRAMLLQYNLNERLWSYALLYAVLVYNVGRHKKLGTTRQQAFLGAVPDVKNFRTFGCRVYARLPETRRSKLDPKSDIGIYLGPANDGPGHKVLMYNPKSAQPYSVQLVRDIVTYEDMSTVCDAQMPSTLRWGGDISLPAGTAKVPQLQEHEDMRERLYQPLTAAELIQQMRALNIGSQAAQQQQPVTAPLELANNVSGPRASQQGNAQMRLPLESDDPGHAPAGGNESTAAPADPGLTAGGGDSMQERGATASAEMPAANAQQQQAEPAMGARGRYPGRQRAPRSWVKGGTAGAPSGFETVAHAAVDTNLCAVFDKHANLLVRSGAAATSATAYSAEERSLKKQKISAPPPGPVPFENLCVAVPATGRIIPLTEAKNYPLPRTPQQAMRSPFASHWLQAMQSELDSLHANNTWELVRRMPGMKVIPCKWVYTIKYDADGNPVRFKARLVAGGHRQEEGIDYDETYAPVSRHATMRTFLSIAAWHGWEVHQLDITTAFLNGDIDTDVYMLQPPGFVDGSNLVCALRKCLYGLKQAPRVWYHTLKRLLTSMGFRCMSADTSFWVKPGVAAVYLTSVVDDMLVASPNRDATLATVHYILSAFKGTHGGVAHHYAGMKLTWLPAQRAVLLTQKSHIDDLAARFQHLHDDWSPRSTPMAEGLRLTPDGTNQQAKSPLLDVTRFPYRSLIGALTYLACTSRPDIAYAVNQLARFSNAPTVAHWGAAIYCLRYLLATADHGIRLGGVRMPVEAYVDSSHGTGTPDGRPVRGHVLLVHGGPVSWASRTQRVTSTSSTEAEYRAMSECAKEALWLGQILTAFAVPHRPFLIKGDNKGAIHAVSNHTVTQHTKHIELHVQFMRERVETGELQFRHVRGKLNPADVLTKALGRVKLQQYRELLGVVPLRRNSCVLG